MRKAIASILLVALVVAVTFYLMKQPSAIYHSEAYYTDTGLRCETTSGWSKSGLGTATVNTPAYEGQYACYIDAGVYDASYKYTWSTYTSNYDILDLEVMTVSGTISLAVNDGSTCASTTISSTGNHQINISGCGSGSLYIRFSASAGESIRYDYVRFLDTSGASCSDNIQNGDETGTDCGGSCPNACSAPSSNSSSGSGSGSVNKPVPPEDDTELVLPEPKTQSSGLTQKISRLIQSIIQKLKRLFGG